jgi:hypothetical protein
VFDSLAENMSSWGGVRCVSQSFQASSRTLNQDTRSALFCDITQRLVVIRYRRFGTAYRSHFQEPRSLSFLDFLTLKMVSIRCTVTSVNDYLATPRNIARGGSLRPRIEDLTAWLPFTAFSTYVSVIIESYIIRSVLVFGATCFNRWIKTSFRDVLS